jgi:hypothetical protein
LLEGVDMFSDADEFWRCAGGLFVPVAGSQVGPRTGRSASGGASCKYLAFLRTPSWQASARPRLTHRLHGRSSPETWRYSNILENRKRSTAHGLLSSSTRNQITLTTCQMSPLTGIARSPGLLSSRSMRILGIILLLGLASTVSVAVFTHLILIVGVSVRPVVVVGHSV